MSAKVMMRSFMLAAAVLAAADAAALDYEALPDDDGLRILVVAGRFSYDEDFGPFIDAVRRHGSTVVTFDSSGGNAYAAMRLGRIIRAKGLHTVQVRRMECASACAYAFMGGNIRMAEAGSIGVHRTSVTPGHGLGTDEAVAGVQSVVADLMDYFREMGVSVDLLDYVLRHESGDIRYLTAAEMRDLGVTSDDNRAQEGGEAVSGRDSEDGLKEAVEGFVTYLVEGNLPLAEIEELYAQEVEYYGRRTSLTEVMRDKEAFERRWPDRGYRVDPASLRVSCGWTRCSASGVYEWAVRSRERRAEMSGTASFRYEIDLEGGPLVVLEAGEVLTRD